MENKVKSDSRNEGGVQKTGTIDTHALAKIGFTLIRDLLAGRVQGGPAAALDLAEALHNLPEPGNTFLEELTLRNLDVFVAKYPEFRSPLLVPLILFQENK